MKADDLGEELKDESRRSWTKYLGIKADDLRGYCAIRVRVKLGSGWNRGEGEIKVSVQLGSGLRSGLKLHDPI